GRRRLRRARHLLRRPQALRRRLSPHRRIADRLHLSRNLPRKFRSSPGRLLAVDGALQARHHRLLGGFMGGPFAPGEHRLARGPATALRGRLLGIYVDPRHDRPRLGALGSAQRHIDLRYICSYRFPRNRRSNMRWIVLPLALALAPASALHRASLVRMSYVFVTGDGSSTMSGSSDAFRRFESLHTGKAPLLFVSEGGAAYWIPEPAILRRAEAIMKPQQDLGRRQGELGRMQGDLGRAQGALGVEQGRLGAQMADTTPRHMGALGARQAALGQPHSALGDTRV